MMYKDMIQFISELRISDKDKKNLKETITQYETALNSASGLILEHYPSLKYQGLDPIMIIEEAWKIEIKDEKEEK